MNVVSGKTFKQLSSQLRRSAEADRRGSGVRPLPGHARGIPTAWSFKSAYEQERMAEFFDRLSIERTDQRATDDDVKAARAFAS